MDSRDGSRLRSLHAGTSGRLPGITLFHLLISQGENKESSDVSGKILPRMKRNNPPTDYPGWPGFPDWPGVPDLVLPSGYNLPTSAPGAPGFLPEVLPPGYNLPTSAPGAPGFVPEMLPSGYNSPTSVPGAPGSPDWDFRTTTTITATTGTTVPGSVVLVRPTRTPNYRRPRCPDGVPTRDCGIFVRKNIGRPF